MDSLPMHKWLLGKSVFKVSSDELTAAFNIMSNKLDKATAQDLKVKVEFFRTPQSADRRAPVIEPVLLATYKTPREAPASLWREAGLIVATFTTAASDMAPAVTATITLGGLTRYSERTRHEMHFEVNPPEIGKHIGAHFMNEEARFIFWNKGVRYN